MKIILIGLLIVISTNVLAQQKTANDRNSVKSIDAIVKEVLNIISGEKGKKRNWDDFRKLFLPTAYFIVLNNNDSISRPIDTATLEQFISSMTDEYYNNGYLGFYCATIK